MDLGEDFVDDVALDVGEAEVAAGVAVGEFFVIETEEMEDGGVEVVDVDAVLGGLESEVVGGAVDVAAFDAPACQPHGESVVIVVATVDFAAVASWGGHFDDGGASEFAAPDDEGFVE